MKQILVATDFSASAANAMKYALELAEILHMEVCAIHAIHPTEGINNSTYNAIFIEDYYNNKRQALKQWVADITDDRLKHIKVTTLCEVGFLKAVIKRHIKQNHVVMLVMGITGATGIAGIVGSNTSEVVTKIKIPTLVIPLESQFARVPVITLATDYETRLSAEDVNALNEMIKAFGPEKMQVLYIDEKPDPALLKTQESKLKRLIKHTKPEFNYIQKSSALNGIMDFITTHETDIICLVKHHHNLVYRLFTRSTVNQIINRSVKAVLVLHE